MDNTLARVGATWDQKRVEELHKLRALLIDVRLIDSGSAVIKRIERCIERATELFQTDLATPSPSFYQFLVDIAILDRERAVWAKDCRVIVGDRPATISRATAEFALQAMREKAAGGYWKDAMADDASFVRAALAELEAATR